MIYVALFFGDLAPNTYPLVFEHDSHISRECFREIVDEAMESARQRHGDILNADIVRTLENEGFRPVTFEWVHTERDEEADPGP